MCGIAGFSGNFDAELLAKMSAKIAHRGPDDSGSLYLPDAQIGLTHRRLAIIDLSQLGRQPMTVACVNCARGLWLTYNGELYNYRQLRQLLMNKGHQFKSQTDSEVLLHLYSEYGVEMLNHLNGMFAFALFDSQNQKLFLARDGIGIKPLYYSEIHHDRYQGFLFASELKALLTLKQISRDLDLSAIHYYLAYLWCPGKQTALKAIAKLQPGEALIVEHGKISKRWFYYDLPYGRNNHELSFNPSSLKEISDELNRRLHTAVSRQLMADVPIGAFLSGGLDSSSIVAMLRRIDPQTRFNCYTIAFDEGMDSEGNCNDLPYAQTVSKHLQMNLKVLRPTAEMIHHLEQMIYHLDEPQADPAAIHVYLIAQAAKQDGIKVLLSGTGGDDIFSGYRRHQALQLSRLLAWLPLSLRKTMAQLASRSLAPSNKFYSFNRQNSLLRRSAKFLSGIHLPVDQQIIQHFLWSSEVLRRTLYSSASEEALRDENTMQPLLQSLARIPQESQTLNRMLYLEAKHFLADHNLNYTDKMSMASGVEVRLPLLDLELIQFATSIPVNIKQRGHQCKFILKKAMENSLPRAVVYRSKAGFGAPLRRWLRHELKPLVDDILSPQQLARRGLFNPQAVTTLIQQNNKRQIDASYTIFSLLAIELWCQQFVDAAPC